MYSGTKKGVFSAKNPLTNKFIPIQSLADSRQQIADSRQQTAEIIEETLSNTASISGAWRPAAHSFGREFFAGLFRLNRFFVAHPGSVPGGNKIRTGGF
ncbi:MAG: hypothetical protein IJX45_10425 [Spirochaetaceae bacterium]|nr:hypothetical protein [Spirochaetaceae bacterium]